MKCVKHNLGRGTAPIKIEIFADLHLGSKKCDYKAIQERIKKVQEDKNTYAIIVGDVINNSTRGSVGDVYEEPLSPMQQINLGIETFRPIKDKILGIVSGNHERRSYKTDGIDLLYFLASELGIEDRYDPIGVLCFIRVGEWHQHIYRSNGKGTHRTGKNAENAIKNNTGDYLYTMYITHGDGIGGRLPGAKANGLQRRGDIINADIIVVGHTHMPLTFKEKKYEIDKRNSKITESEMMYVNASATLDYESYAEMYGFRPSSKASPVIILSATDHDMQCIL